MDYEESEREKEWYDWVEKTYYSWRGETRATVLQFAAYLGVSQPTVSAWMNRRKGVPKTQKVIRAVLSRYPEAADFLDVDPFYNFLSSDWPNMSPETKEAILRVWREDLEDRKDVAGLQGLEKFVAQKQT
jgi:hypothetical protein